MKSTISVKPIPDAVLDKHVGILGINGSGKTYTAKGAVERLLDQGRRVCIIDPTGVWYGLKSSSNGKRGAYPIVVFGGLHADVQISGAHGEAIAELIGKSSTPAIIDTSMMKVGERTKFFADFAETLRIKNIGPLYLFIDEAHLFAPQGRVSDPQSAQMLHAANNLISLGRARGLRVTLISQRPAKLHKDSLTQVHSLISMRLIAPHDRAAVEDWIDGQADMATGKKIIASLPSLKTGEGWLWSPEAGILERQKFPSIKTFDSSRAPDGESTGAGPVLAPIDIGTVQAKLEAVRIDTVSNDPVKLKARIADLTAQIKKAETSAPPTAQAIKEADFEGFRRGKIAGYSQGIIDSFKETDAIIDKEVDKFRTGIKGVISEIMKDFSARFNHYDRPQATDTAHLETKRLDIGKQDIVSGSVLTFSRDNGLTGPATLSDNGSKPVTLKRDGKPLNAGDIKKGQLVTFDSETGEARPSPAQQRVLNSLLFWREIGYNVASKQQVAFVAGYSPKSSGYRAILGSLSVGGYIKRNGDGLELIKAESALLNTESEPRNMLLSVLGRQQKQVIAALDKSGNVIAKEELATGAGYSPHSSGFRALLSGLSVLGIIDRVDGGVKMSEWACRVLS